jgi:hypothetical protein
MAAGGIGGVVGGVADGGSTTRGAGAWITGSAIGAATGAGVEAAGCTTAGC